MVRGTPDLLAFCPSVLKTEMVYGIVYRTAISKGG
jgi:hypothetical protein